MARPRFFSMLLISIIALTGLLLTTVTGCNSPGTAGVPPASPTINPETRDKVIGIVMTISKIAANTYIDKMVADDKITADEATTYKQIVSDIKLPATTAPEVTATDSNVGADVPAANNGSSGASGTPDIASP